jgi:SAM-dependent methyltransferase
MSGDTLSRVKPSTYGEWWNTNAKGVAWYQEIHDAREPVHDAFERWVAERDRPHDPIRSVLEIGCGRGVRYPALFADRRYVGYDISRKEIEWCRANRPNPLHEYLAGDFIADGVAGRFDLVFAHAVIDHVYDIDAFVRAAVDASDRWVYFTAYRGWFPDLREHRYRWSRQDACFYNDLSPTRIQSVLAERGWRPVRVSPSAAVVEPIGRETEIVAERPTQTGALKESDPRDLQPEVTALRRAIDDSRTPLERLNRKLSTWWHRYVRPVE